MKGVLCTTGVVVAMLLCGAVAYANVDMTLTEWDWAHQATSSTALFPDLAGTDVNILGNPQWDWTVVDQNTGQGVYVSHSIDNGWCSILEGAGSNVSSNWSDLLWFHDPAGLGASRVTLFSSDSWPTDVITAVTAGGDPQNLGVEVGPDNGPNGLVYNVGGNIYRVGSDPSPPTPELSSGALLLVGALPLGLAWLRRRRKT
jgi:hypothetical protein